MSEVGSGHGHNSIIILLDECGDLGRSPNSSRHFVVAAMMVRDPHELVQSIKNARRKLGKRGTGKESSSSTTRWTR
ncbi:hypothetical protein [Methanomassiliicoccus luminyensis]|uniref:hypothetical protein n=1 Tax=Methanomassiliicoccus luminyensis TaxID=1080712 RepID=UPI0011C89510|nr:hypothetical protein [Methanomassiliicoccus luminyensis]